MSLLVTSVVHLQSLESIEQGHSLLTVSYLKPMSSLLIPTLTNDSSINSSPSLLQVNMLSSLNCSLHYQPDYPQLCLFKFVSSPLILWCQNYTHYTFKRDYVVPQL